jgi:hypothetical protein
MTLNSHCATQEGTNHSCMINTCNMVYKESSRESSNSSWHSSHPLVASNNPVSSSSGNSWLTGSVMTFWLGTGVISSLLSALDLSLVSSSQFSTSVSPHMEMLDKMLCFRSPVL